jgi:hypothetical protein
LNSVFLKRNFHLALAGVRVLPAVKRTARTISSMSSTTLFTMIGVTVLRLLESSVSAALRGQSSVTGVSRSSFWLPRELEQFLGEIDADQ